MKNKFKIGDRVRVTDMAYEYGGKYIGEIGIIKKEIYFENYGVKLNGHWNDNSTMEYFWFGPRSLVLRENYQEELNKKDVLVGDMKTGYSYVTAKEAEELRINEEIKNEYYVTAKKELELRTKELAEYSKILLNSRYGCMSIQEMKMDEIEKVIFNNPATIVLWSDGTKTIVKCSEDECFDEEKGLAMAISKKVLGNKGNYYNEFKKWLPMIEEGENV